MLAPMSTAIGTAHGGKPVWVTEGGAELPLTNLAAAAALALVGPGRYSLDGALGIRLPRAFVALVTVATLTGIAIGLLRRETTAPARPGAEAEPEHGGQGSEAQPASSAAAWRRAAYSSSGETSSGVVARDDRSAPLLRSVVS